MQLFAACFLFKTQGNSGCWRGGSVNIFSWIFATVEREWGWLSMFLVCSARFKASQGNSLGLHPAINIDKKHTNCFYWTKTYAFHNLGFENK